MEVSHHQQDDGEIQWVLLPNPTMHAQKTKKWSVKLWILANYVSNMFTILRYIVERMQELMKACLPLGDEANATYVVVMGLLVGLEEKEHCLVMDDFFGSIQLFTNLIAMGTYATNFGFTFFFL